VSRSRPSHFADRLVDRARGLGHPLCAGLDPHLALVPPLFRRGAMAPGAPETAAAVRDLCLAFVERAAARAVCIKPQSAFFEQLGPEGVHVLAEVMAAIRQAGCPALLDVKRGDIGSTGEAYALAYLDAAAPMPADALTLSPYLGLDSLEPFLARVRDAGRGIFVLVKTSNPGSGDFQDREVGGRPLFERVAEALAPAAKEAVGPQTGWSSLGVVVGATYPEQAEAVRALLPHSLLLVPGYGAQGASAGDAVRGFVPGPAGLEGGVVSSSRGLLFPAEAAEARDAASWGAAVDRALDAACAELGAAVRA